jgi:hypothetical protein
MKTTLDLPDDLVRKVKLHALLITLEQQMQIQEDLERFGVFPG